MLLKNSKLQNNISLVTLSTLVWRTDEESKKRIERNEWRE